MTPVAYDVVAILAEASIRALLIAAGVGLLVHVLRVRTSGARHAVWAAVLITMLALPVLPHWLPAIPVWIPERPAAQTVVAVTVPETPTARPAPETSSGVTSTTVASVTTEPRSQEFARPAASRSLSWPTVALFIWAIVAFVLIARLMTGWRYAARLAARSRPAFLAGVDTPLYESDLVATPVTVGVFRPRIIVPASWAAWPADMRHAVLIHERAHIRRRDTLINFLARLNRSLFWFHPLAWWLERRLAVAAEHACDDEVIRASGDRSRYADLLVRMADAVRESHGRVAWQGVGMAGSGALGARIDRVLAGHAPGSMTRTHKLVVSLTCAGAIVLGAACQRTVPPLREDPETAQRLQRNAENAAKYEAAKNLTLAQVAELEAAVARNPDDLEATGRLLYFYRESGQKLMGWNEMVAARRPHLLRMIERHPESEYNSWPLPQRLDPDGWAQARALWMGHVNRPDVTSARLGRAARFFAISEKPVAEELLLRAKAMDPNGPQPRVVENVYYAPWSSRLGELYARAIVGSDDDTLFNVVRSVSLAEANGSFAAKAKRTLETTSDAQILRAAGSYLTRNASRREDGTVGDQKITLGFDHRALGQSYLDRAVALDPESAATKQNLLARKIADFDERQWANVEALLGDTWRDATREQVAALSDSDRLTVLPMLATEAFLAAESAEYYKKDQAGYRAAMARANAYASDLLTVADGSSNDPRLGPARYAANVTLGAIAMREGDRREAVRYLQAAAAALSKDDLIGSHPSMVQQRLTNNLLKAGERESMADFYDQVSKHVGLSEKSFTDAARAIREGRMPQNYQYAMTAR